MIKALRGKKIENILFFDIETVPLWEDSSKMPKGIYECWWNRVKWKIDPYSLDTGEMEYEQDFRMEQWNKIGLMPEFSRVVCIAIGYLRDDKPTVWAECEKDEEVSLKNFKFMLESKPKSTEILCTHNGNLFDIPFLATRMLVHGIPIPPQLDMIGVKPWLIPHIDTMDLWPASKFVSMRTVALALGLPDPKGDMSGVDIAGAFAAEKYRDIEKYAESDVLTLINIFRAFRNEEPVHSGE